MLFVQALLAGARYLFKLPAMTITLMTVAIDHVVILHLPHPFLLNNFRYNCLSRIQVATVACSVKKDDELCNCVFVLFCYKYIF